MARKSRKDLIRAANSGQALPEQKQSEVPAEVVYTAVGTANPGRISGGPVSRP